MAAAWLLCCHLLSGTALADLCPAYPACPPACSACLPACLPAKQGSTVGEPPYVNRSRIGSLMQTLTDITDSYEDPTMAIEGD